MSGYWGRLGVCQIPHDWKSGACVCAPPQLCTPEASTASVSLHDTSWQPEDCIGHSDKVPVLAQHAEQGALSSTENVLPYRGILDRNPTVQLKRYRVGELSLPGEPGCLSLPGKYRTNDLKRQGETPAGGGPSSPCVNAGASAQQNGEYPQKIRYCNGVTAGTYPSRQRCFAASAAHSGEMQGERSLLHFTRQHINGRLTTHCTSHKFATFIYRRAGFAY